MSENLNKKPPKGILKQSSSFDKPGVSNPCQALNQSGCFGSSETISSGVNRKSTKFDEMNIIETLHPPDKDYGHMKIEEPKTPFNYYDDGEDLEISEQGIDPSILSKRLETAKDDISKPVAEESSEEEVDDDPEAIAKRQMFESKRKAHYNEYYAVKLARKLLEQEHEEEEEDECKEEEEDSNQSGRRFVPNEELDGN